MHILIVDDQETNLQLFAALVGKMGKHESTCFLDPQQALNWCGSNNPDLVILDYMMPKLNGLEFLARFRALANCREVPLLMVTADHEKDIRYRALQARANDFLTKPIDKTEFLARADNMLLLRRQQLALQDRAVLLELEVEKATAEIGRRERETIIRLSYAAEFRDPETGAHIQRMANYSLLIAQNLGLSKELQHKLLRASPMHDIGKVGIPDQILLKPDVLTVEEYSIIKTHTTIGYNILRNSDSDLLRTAAEIAHCHHEKFDGSGYPNALHGGSIPLSGRICAVADVFDALTSERPYKHAWPFDSALQTIRKGSGNHFDPDCVDAFLLNPDKIMDIHHRYQDPKTSHSANSITEVLT